MKSKIHEHKNPIRILSNIIVIYSLAAGLLFGACKSKGTTFTSDDGDTKVTVDMSNAEETANEMNAKMEELKTQLPEELLGMKRSNFSVNSAMGTAMGDATYKKDDTTDIHLTIFDCAGEAGATYYMANYWTKMSMESQNDQGYTKTVDFLGGKALEDYKNYNNTYTMTFTANDRLMVTIAGRNVSLSTIQDAVKALNLKVNS